MPCYELVPDASAPHPHLALIAEPFTAVAPMILANQVKGVVLSVIRSALLIQTIGYHVEHWRSGGNSSFTIESTTHKKGYLMQ